MLFDWLVVGQVLAVNPAAAVRGPRYVVRTDKTPVLSAEEARHLPRALKQFLTSGGFWRLIQLLQSAVRNTWSSAPGPQCCQRRQRAIYWIQLKVTL
jgi:hypothetical protein